jgi:hypothetical protein
MDSETAEAFERLSHDFQEGLRELRTELRGEIREVKTELRAEIQDVKRHSDVIAESLRGEIRLVAEGVAGLDEKFTPEFRTVREEIGEVKTLVRLSYEDLDRRIKPS